MARHLGPTLKAAYPKAIATLIRLLSDIDDAEEALQEAMVRALQNWPRDGIPDNPGAWLVTVGRNYHTDMLRRRALSERYGRDIAVLRSDGPGEDVTVADAGVFGDDLLRLIFTCCHPSLSESSQVALTLKVVAGFTVDEVARSLLTSPKTVEQRITRAKKSVAEHSIVYEVPPPDELPERLAGVLRVIYAMFNHGYSCFPTADPWPGGLCDTAIRLARLVVRLFAHHSEAKALLALCLLSSARLSSRFGPAGQFIPLSDQRRDAWNRSRIHEGRALVNALTLSRPPPGTYLIQAAISALHCDAPTWADTDWQQIDGLYERLRRYEASPAVTVNWAIARKMSGDGSGAMALLEPLLAERRLATYQPLFVAAADIARDLERLSDAAAWYQRAITLTTSGAERVYLENRLSQLAQPGQVAAQVDAATSKHRRNRT